MNTGFLYLGRQTAGWLHPAGRLLEPLALDQPGQPLLFEAKRDYLLQSLARFQPDSCAILLDSCSEVIDIIAPQKATSNQPFFITPGVPSLNTSARLSAQDSGAGELLVTGRLHHKGDRAGLWPGSRQRLPTVSRRFAYPDQQEVLEWQTLLQELASSRVDIFSYTLITEYLLQPLFIDLPGVLIVSKQPDRSLRHLFFQNGWLRFSRQLPEEAEELEDNLQSSARYVQRHLGFAEPFPVYFLAEPDSAGGRQLQLMLKRINALPEEEAQPLQPVLQPLPSNEITQFELRQEPIAGVHATLQTSLMQRQRELHFAVRRRAIDKLKRWRVQSRQMQQHAASASKTRRTQRIVSSWIVIATVLAVWQVSGVWSLWQQKRFQDQRLSSLQTIDQSDRAESIAAMPVSGAAMGRLLELPQQIARQSYVEPIATLHRLQHVITNYPNLQINSIDWQQLSSGRQQASEGLRAALALREYDSETTAALVDPARAGLGVLLVSIRGQIDTDANVVASVASISQHIDVFESFLHDLKTAFSLQSYALIDYPFGVNPGAKLSLTGTGLKPERRIPLAEQTDQSIAEFAFEFVLTQSLLTELLLEISALCPAPLVNKATYENACIETGGQA